MIKNNKIIKEEVPEGMVPYILTKKDFKENPALKEEGLKVGETIFIPISPEEPTNLPLVGIAVEKPTTKKPTTKKVKELQKPVWADQSLWDSLSQEQKQDLVNGKRSF